MGLYLVLGGTGSGKSAYAEELCRKYSSGNNSKLWYIATMFTTGDEESRAKIHRHRKMRSGKGFSTIECYLMGSPVKSLELVDNNDDNNEKRVTLNKDVLSNGILNLDIQGEDIVLLEDLSNLLANEIYMPGGRLYSVLKKSDNLSIIEASNITSITEITEDTSDMNTIHIKAYELKKLMEDNILLPILGFSSRVRECVIVGSEIFSDGAVYSPETEAYLLLLGMMQQWLSERAETVTELVSGVNVYLKKPYTYRAFEGDAREADNVCSDDNVLMRGLVFVIGGKYQGMEEFAESKFPEARIIRDYHDIVRANILKGKDPIKEAKKLITASSYSLFVILSLEIGMGVVPVSKEERTFREVNGRVNCFFAREAREVYRVVAGIGERIK